MFEQYGAYLRQDMPTLLLEGEIYPPSNTARIASNILFAVRLLLIGLILGGPDILQRIGINQPPQWYLWMYENKVYYICMYVTMCMCTYTCTCIVHVIIDYDYVYMYYM